MDLLRFPEEHHFQHLVQLYRERYAGRKLDLIIATLGASREFLARYKNELFPDTPVLFVDIDTRLIDHDVLKNDGAIVTGRFDLEGTLELALGLHREVRDVFVVSGTSSLDRSLEDLAKKAFQRFEDRVGIHWLSGFSLEEILEKVSRLPEHSIIFYLALYRDAKGKTFLSHQALSMISEKAAVPIYGLSEYFIGAGMVGGHLYSFSKLGDKTAQSALRLLSGESADQIQPLEERADRYVFDWHQLKRWNIDEDSLPPGSLIRNKIFSAWETYRLQIVAAGSALILQFVLIMALISNLVRRRQAKCALIHSEEKLQKAANEWKITFDSIPDPIMVLDSELRIARVNRATAAFLNLPLDGIPGSFYEILRHGNRTPFDGRLLEKTLETKEREEEEVFDKDRDAWFLVSVFPILDKRGEMTGILCSARNVTERKRAEAEAHRRMTELAHVTRVSTMGELAASLAHEINQPLTAILANAQAAQRFLSHPKPNLDEIREILDDIVQDDQRVSEVIRRMRALLKKQMVSRETFNVNEVVTESIALVNSAHPLDGLTITSKMDLDPIHVKADRVQVQQVLFNLLMNAAGAMRNTPPSSRSIRLRTSIDDGRMVKVSVTDCGTGIDEHNMNLLFEPFYTTKPEGLGMGLSISQTIINAHGGEMRVCNNPEGGATFTFTLPVDPDHMTS